MPIISTELSEEEFTRLQQHRETMGLPQEELGTVLKHAINAFQPAQPNQPNQAQTHTEEDHG